MSLGKNMRRWTQEERLRQSQLIQKWKPWKLGGVKTPEGRAISKMNGYKHGMRSAAIREVEKMLTKFKKQIAYELSLTFNKKRYKYGAKTK